MADSISMKILEHLEFDLAPCRRQVDELRDWPDAHPALGERAILDFFRRRPHFSAFVGSYSPNINRFDRIAFEYPLFGDFTCDLVVGDSAANAYCFIEFEDAGPRSLLVHRARKATRESSPRFDHVFSQIIDWFHKLGDMEKSSDYTARFGAPSMRYSGVLIVGRERYLGAGERERLVWRSDRVIVSSRVIQCTTLDGLAQRLRTRLAEIPLSFQAGG